MSKKIHSLNTDDDKPPRGHDHSSGSESDDDEGRQGFFVGGSERSGQQVLGPNRDEMRSNLFEAIQRAGAERLTPEQVEALDRKKQALATSQNSETTGIRLGGHGVASEYIPSANSPLNQNSQAAASVSSRQQTVRMFIWRNGFSIDEGPLRSFDDPQNRAFLAAVMAKRIPPELSQQYPGREVDLRIEKKPEDYVPPKAKPFSGKGHRLGSVVPEIVGGSSRIVDVIDLDALPALNKPEDAIVAKAQEDVHVDNSQPVTRIQIRFPDVPQPIVAQFNHNHTVDQLRNFIVAIQPSLAYSPFHIMTIYPRKVIGEEHQSIKDAGLLNAAVTVKFEEKQIDSF